ncbi:hypothetical protein SHK09_14950 [Polaribacter sp. PL03]|uniref:hypothetical protein n=1 Tax=Polaribacter sp. PL03 TaxID=3088353 RepID=UPI0029CD8BFB|nr:hypothetical protein [Polaribacter sp. PL03]MDX6748093.1 hypothetical protein [Polaribacter sp. PL03]
MKIKILSLLIIFPFIINSQELKKSDLIGNWKFKKYILIREMPQDTVINVGGGITVEYGKSTDLEYSDIEITKEFYKEDGFESDFWEILNYEIIPHNPVPKSELEFYKKHSVGIIEKLENGKYYYTKPIPMKILSLNKNELIIEDYYCNIIYERK